MWPTIYFHKQYAKEQSTRRTHQKKQYIPTGDLESSGRTHRSGDMEGRPYEVKKFTKQTEGRRISYRRVGQHVQIMAVNSTWHFYGWNIKCGGGKAAEGIKK